MLPRVAADEAGIRRAADLLVAGRVVAFPTDTAYGLGALPDRPDAVMAIYALKGRSPSLPLILLAAAPEDLDAWATLPDSAAPLIARWWPGPLTLVVPSSSRTPEMVRARDGSVGIRIPAHPAALRLLSVTGPLATTSANRSSGASPRSADAVARAFARAKGLAMLLDGGPTSREVDSTVLSLIGPPRILRQGAISAAELEDLLQ